MLNIMLRIAGLVIALSSAILVAARGECTPSSGAVTFNYTRFGAFVFFVGSTITATILEAVALYLQIRLNLAADPEENTVANNVLELVDLLVPPLLYSAMTSVFMASADNHDQIGACVVFAGQVDHAKIMSLFACLAIWFADAAKRVPFLFNVPAFLG